MKLLDLNRQGGIGANCLFVQIGGVNLLIDSGLNPKHVGRVATPDFGKIRGERVDLIVITHCHLDHIGSVPVAMREFPDAPVIMTASSRILIERMLHNSTNVMKRQKEENDIPEYPLFSHEEIDRCARRMVGLNFGMVKRFHGVDPRHEIEIVLHPAGHVAGACALEVRHKHRGIFFTGDVLFDNLRTLPGAHFPTGHFDTIVTETTRGLTEREVGKERVHEVDALIKSINDTIGRGGSFLLPVFALGRMQEILTILHDARRFGKLVDCPIIGSGLGIALCDYFDEIRRKTQHVQFNRSTLKELKLKALPRKVTPGQDPQRNGLFVVSSGMLVENTPSYALASGLLGHHRNTIGFVGYCDPDTPGGKLLECKPGDDFIFETVHVRSKVKARIERYELSGHAEREELLEFALQATPRAVVLTHGDPAARKWFEGQFAARGPDIKVLDPVPGQTYQV
ncbi:MBL fold metallo-hydrolase [Synoicihabitans lomoniglobus]|uniref:MBL fold metallo-hydrolase n=1 Tax=Synoicihabitans lomoniglobus TaxID=2909285 RepID=A0AAF0CRU6_9BACT|nr:MBL fold metallo-hydrolase [Opitutaceae bacterium LMO-M01]WED66880.1 MBL fold metallo-hydrolase [Opitutaceae bacterium LMO-M01]